MGGLALHGDTDPHHALLRDLHHRSAGRPPVRDHYDVFIREQTLIDQILYSLGAAGLLVGHEHDPQRHALQILVDDRPGCEHRRDDGLTVVLRAPSVDPPVPVDRPERGRVPFLGISGRYNVHVRDHPNGSGLPATLRGDYVAPHHRRIGVVGCVEPPDGVEPRELPLEIVGLPALTVSAVDRCQGGDGYHADHGVHHVIVRAFDLLKRLFQGSHAT